MNIKILAEKEKNNLFSDCIYKSSNSSNRFVNGALREEVEQLPEQKK